MLRCGRRRHHLTAGADAEGKGAAAAGQVAGEAVVAGGQVRPGVAVLGLADGGLVMLDADADGEGFALHGDAGSVEEGKGVSGGVAGRQYEGISGEVVGALRTGDGETGQAAGLLAETGELVAESDMIAVVPEQVARHITRRYPCRSWPLPFPLAKIAIRQVWHQRLHRDPGHIWLRSLIATLADPAQQSTSIKI